MPVQKTLNRDAVLAQFPWVQQRDQKMVVGTDLDATLSSILAHHIMGWEIVGFYDLKNIYAAAPNPDLYNAVWLDLDICHANIKSLGHHILTFDEMPLAAQAQNLNVNNLRGVTIQNYTRKYPLGTFHILCWLWNVELPFDHPLTLPLYWLPDSAYINAQSDRPTALGIEQRTHYRRNVLDWVQNCLPIEVLTKHINTINDCDFEDTVANLIRLFEQNGWPVNPTKTMSNCHGLSGGQCRFDRLNASSINALPARLNALYNIIAQITGWNIPVCPNIKRTFTGRRINDLSTIINPLTNVRLATFLTHNNVFSYALPFIKNINYTIFGEDWNP